MTDQALTLGFRNRYLTVNSNCPDVLRSIQCSFRHLLAQPPAHAVQKLEASQRGPDYFLSGVRNCIGAVSFDEAIRGLKFEIGLQFIDATPGLLWFHAGAAAFGGSAVVILGPWGCGKSTLVTALYGSGWSFLADDILPLDPASGNVLAFPKNPASRAHAGTQLGNAAVAELDKTECDIENGRVCASPVPVAALVFPEFLHNAEPNLSRVPASDAAVNVLGATLNFKEHGAESAMRFVATLVQTTPVFRLIYGGGEQAAALIIQKHGNWQRT